MRRVQGPARPGSVTALGVDVGTTNTKAALVEVDGAAVTVRAVATTPTPPPDRLAGVLDALVREVVAAGGATGPRAPAAVGIASMAETGVPLDADDRPVGDWLRWDGHAAAAPAAGAALATLRREVGADALARATGVRLAAKVPLATWARLAADEPGRWSRLVRWAGAADLVALLLTGRLVTDHTLAGRTGAHRLPEPGAAPHPHADADLLAVVGLRPAALPEVVGPGQVAAAVRAGAPGGLPAGTPVVVAGHDHPVGAWAAGVRAPGHVADSLGTAEALCAVVAAEPDRRAVARAGMSTVRTVEGEVGLVAGGPGGAVVRWWQEHSGTDVSALPPATTAAGGPAPPVDAVVLPYPAGRQTPAGDPSARVRVLGDPGDALARAVVEGMALHAAWMLRELAALAAAAPVPAGAAPPPVPGAAGLVVLGGAGAANAGWLDAKARLTPAALRVVDVAEPVAAGAALLALHRAGCLGGPPPVLPSRAGGAALPRAVQDAALDRFVAAALAPAGPQEDP
ncbi:FGGY-family carbohydrate kinase [Cellulomonas endophytica]|uniref:FGGY-family carbohydrate kinase n=1 Tax=Cellulomonas endophytica TaxID=2494735 RepID=UPI0013E9424F|nr:FGGY family carbohydrate kinase [Cellulomonas endophytica]